MKKLLLVLIVLFPLKAFADTCSAGLMPAFTAAQATALCTKLGDSIAESLIPQSSNSIDLGSASKTWRTLYIGTSIVSSGNIYGPVANKAWANGLSAVPADVTTISTPQMLLFNGSGGGAGLITAQGAADANGTNNNFLKSRSTDGSADTIVQSGDIVSLFTFYGANGTTFDPAARIKVTIDGTPGASADMPGAIDFQTVPDGSATPASALKLNSAKLATFGGDISFSSATNIIGTASADAADSGRITIFGSGTGSADSTRSATLRLTGNENAGAGLAQLVMGGTADFSVIGNAGGTTILTVKGTAGGAGGIEVTGGGDVKIATSGGTVALQEATAGAACSGTATCNGATDVTTATTCATTGSRIFLQRSSADTDGVGQMYVKSISNGTNFVVNCVTANDTSTFNWIIFHEAP